MPELLSPGVYIQEVAFGPEPIEGVSTSTAGFVGETERGPTTGQPTLVTSFPDFQNKFGGYVSGKNLAYAVRGFFDNGGLRAYIVRVIGDPATAASVAILNGYDVALLNSVTQAMSSTPYTLRVASVVGVQVSDTITIIHTDGTPLPDVVTVQSINATMSSLTVSGALSEDIGPMTHAIRYASQPQSTSHTTVTFSARDDGQYGNHIRVRLTPVYLANATISGVGMTSGTSTDFYVNPVAPFVAGTTVELEQKNSPQGRAYCTVISVDPASNKVALNNSTISATYAAGDFIRVTGWKLEVYSDATLVETITGISSDNSASDGVVQKLVAESQWVRAATGTLAIEAVSPSATDTTFPYFPIGLPVTFDPGSGSDGTLHPSDIIGSDVVPRTGLKALESQDGVNIIAAPGYSGQLGVVSELIGQAERRMDRFAVFESVAADDDIGTVLTERGLYNSEYAAMYHPWIQVLDPITNQPIDLPPSGHIIGCYARTDSDRGVFKAPANVTLQGILGFSQTITDGEQDILNPAGVDALRQLDGLGLVIWGARTISADSLWRYVSVRRLFIFIEQSLVVGTRFAVFEPNDQRLWARLRDSVSNFLTTQWRAGALFGSKPSEAFFVKVDETTTTQDDRDNGRVNILVGIAPVKPAEFIVFQIGQAPQSVIISEQS